jgi:hypothetical protein
MNSDTVRCPRCGLSDHLIGIEVQGVYDGVLYFRCTADGATWHRFPEGHELRARAEPFVSHLTEMTKPAQSCNDVQRASEDRRDESLNPMNGGLKV